MCVGIAVECAKNLYAVEFVLDTAYYKPDKRRQWSSAPDDEDEVTPTRSDPSLTLHTIISEANEKQQHRNIPSRGA